MEALPIKVRVKVKTTVATLGTQWLRFDDRTPGLFLNLESAHLYTDAIRRSIKNTRAAQDVSLLTGLRHLLGAQYFDTRFPDLSPLGVQLADDRDIALRMLSALPWEVYHETETLQDLSGQWQAMDSLTVYTWVDRLEREFDIDLDETKTAAWSGVNLFNDFPKVLEIIKKQIS